MRILDKIFSNLTYDRPFLTQPYFFTCVPNSEAFCTTSSAGNQVPSTSPLRSRAFRPTRLRSSSLLPPPWNRARSDRSIKKRRRRSSRQGALMNCDLYEITSAAIPSPSETPQQREQHLWPTRRRHAETLKPRPPLPAGRDLPERKGQPGNGRQSTAKVILPLTQPDARRRLIVITFSACHDQHAVQRAVTTDVVLLADLSPRLKNANVIPPGPESAARHRRFTDFGGGHDRHVLRRAVPFEDVLPADLSAIGCLALELYSFRGESLCRHSSCSEDSSLRTSTPVIQGGAAISSCCPD
ncbi:hypothetical protein HPB50_025054 [Hyalomma asiaticum]|uniref:Uncharacterized protein n=1 Tax=Hyalomma asiaticum TaxID=266040 RepID=A0ACB7TBI2_HYAAI|nr:hypothetical protein HPB50_025054 [Hyalomma asiaticum]